MTTTPGTINDVAHLQERLRATAGYIKEPLSEVQVLDVKNRLLDAADMIDLYEDTCERLQKRIAELEVELAEADRLREITIKNCDVVVAENKRISALLAGNHKLLDKIAALEADHAHLAGDAARIEEANAKLRELHGYKDRYLTRDQLDCVDELVAIAKRGAE